MADVVNKTTMKYLVSVNTPDYDSADWFINPDLSAVVGVPNRYWKNDSGSIVEMTQAEKDAVDAAMVTSPPPRGIQDYVNLGGKSTSEIFERIGTYLYRGSDEVGEPHTVEFLGRIDAGAVGEIRLYDQDNGMILGSASFNSSSDERITLDIVGEWPTSASVMEIQIERTSGSSDKFVYCDSIVFAY